MLYLASINTSLYNILNKNKDVILMGEDLLDPYGGAFKVSKGLSTDFPNQVISTPISESAIIGSAIGMAIRGLKPIVEIMFGDFVTLAADQIINHATKYNWMYYNKVNVPLVIRTPVGGRRGYGPTHSQSLESIFMSIPGLRIVAPSICHEPGKILQSIIDKNNEPLIFVEYKVDYSKKIQKEKYEDFIVQRKSNSLFGDDIILSLYPDEKPDVIILTYGGNLSLAVEAAKKLFFDEELIVNIALPSTIKPIDINFINESLKKCGRIIILEEGNLIGGWGAEVSSVIHEKYFNELNYPVQRLGAKDYPIPSSGPMELEMLPSSDELFSIINKMT
jgi:pyruvate/2-oxoglutarate/acetoin dehydrogenase E1 component